ncbi:AAHS family 4-hydroxybenzoate transporter-like MFS transporter [Bradyrhizobium sp. AZCC 2262]|uniref:MFS transporter n=1 Tax=Bradyrhizobium sp. AZCC 2262 TaxID=3117022 RepID=UPI002FF27A73
MLNKEVPSSQPSRVDVAKVIDEASFGGFHLRTALLLFAIMLLDGFDTQIIAFVAPAIGKELHIPPTSFGIIFSAGLFGAACGAFVLGRLADRIGRRVVLLACIFGFALATLACAYAKSYELLVALRVLGGIGLGGAMPNLFALASEYSPAKYRITVVTMTLWGIPLGGVLGGFLTAALIQDFGWPIAFWIGGVVPLFLLLIFYFVVPESVRFLTLQGRSPEVVARTLNKIVSGNQFAPTDKFVLQETKVSSARISDLFSREFRAGTVLLSLTLFFSFVIVFLLTSWIPLVLTNSGLPIERAVMGTVVFNISGIVGSLIVSWIVQRVNPLPIICGGYFIGACAVVAIGLVPAQATPLMICIFLGGFFIVGVHLSIVGYIAAFYPTQIRATGIGFTQSISRIGSFIGPMLGGLLISFNLSHDHLFQWIALPSVIAAITVFALEKSQSGKVA